MGRHVSGLLLVAMAFLCAASALASAQILSGPTQLENCDEGLFTITFTNPSPTQTACQIVFEHTPPSSEFVYVAGSGSMTVPGYGTISADPVLGRWSVDDLVGSAYELPPGETVAVEYRLATTCLAVSGTVAAQVDYVDCTQPGTPLQASDSVSVEILPGALTIRKLPANPPGGVGDLVTWTLTVSSTGLGSIKNVVLTDTLGSGLEYVSSSPVGSAVGQVVTWDAGDIAALADIDPDDSVEITLVARVIACTGLENRLDTRCGCDDGSVCNDTAAGLGECGSGPATSSVAFIQRLPFLEFSAPTITIPYCAATNTVTIPVHNTGDGTAHEGTLCPSNLGSLVISNVQGGATYTGGCFHLPDIAGSTTYDLTFDVTYVDDWCTSAPSGSPLYTLQYTNDCGVVHQAAPQFGSIGASAAPGLSVSKTGPSVVQFGSQVTYNITATYSGPTSCGPGGTTGVVTVTDQLPSGFSVIASAGGTWVPGPGGTGGTVTWTFDPAVSASSGWSLTVQVPLDCDFCYTEQTNTVAASTLSCCGCVLSASSSATMAITCERLYTSTLSLSPSASLERCGDAVTFTDSNTFANDAALDTITFGDFAYAFIKENGLSYVPGSATATIDGSPTAVVVTDGPTELALTVTDSGSVRGHTLTFTYDMQATSASTPACGSASSFYVWASHMIPAIGPCTLFYNTALLTIQPPSMSVGISGVPTIQEDCATYPVTITFRRTSAIADPYDARLVLTGTSGVIADFAGATWSGVTPSEAPIVGPNSVEWRFADGFDAPGAVATLSVPVTAKCGGPLIGLSAVGTFDDLCNDIAGYNDTCSTSASASSSLRLIGDVHISKTPEVIYTTQRTVTWQIEIYNSSNGTAYNVYVDDVLGSGLVYASSSASGYSGSLTTQPNQSHLGAPINGASFLFERVAPGERPVITFTADLVACNSMTNTATVGWGCGGDACQAPRSDSSYVLVAPANVVSTSLAVTPTDACAIQKATMTLRSAGIATAYNLAATTTLPTGLVYAGNPEYRVGGGAWGPASAPSGAPGPALMWTKNEVATLAAVAPGVTIDIRFDVEAECSFNGGITQARSSYENPCGQTFLSAIGTFTIATRKPTLALVATQTSPAAGQPIPCGGNVTWEIRVTNSGPAVASAVWVEQTLGAGLTYVSSTGGADGGSGSGQTATWEILNLGVGSTAVLTATANSTGGPADCTALTSSIRAYWACGPDGNSATTPDCLSSTYASASTTATRTVSVTAAAAMSPNSIGSCETQKTLTVTLSNASTSAPAYNPDIRLTLPAGLVYRAGTTETNCGGGFAPAADPQQAGQVLTWYNIAATGPGNDLCTSIPASGSVAVRFQVDAACYRTTANATLTLYYYDCCGATQYTVTTSPSLAASSPTLSVTMAPSTATLDCANPLNTVTWTITVTNTGGSTAGFVRIIDTLGADLVRVSGGTQIGANPQQWGWEIGPLAPGGSQSVTLEARLAAPPNDCAVARRTSTAVSSWGCTLSALDGNPNTTAEYSCTSSGGSVTRTATVLVPDVSISSSDLSPQFTCASDGISDGRVLLTVRNTGTAAISSNFSITYSESTTGWSGSGTFTSLGGTLPLAAGGNQVLTLTGWPIACSSCSYQFTATLDTGGALCECRENNNTATLSYTPTSPDLVVALSTLTPSCAGDGQVRVQGSVTLRNQGCSSSPLTTNVPMRFTVYAGPTCSGTVLDQWTQTFTGVSIAAGGGTQAFAVDRTAAYNACSPCQVSILIEADYSNAICECDGTNNTLCAGPLSIAFPDLIVGLIDFTGVGCANDAISGSVAVTVANQGCGAAGAFNVSLTTSGCLTFSSQRVAGLAAGANVVVQFPIATTWSGCGTCACTFTATVDTGSEVCECAGTNNSATAAYTSPLPDLVITAFTASAASPCLPGSAQVTVRNAGCGIAPAGVVVGITGDATGQVTTSIALAAGESQAVSVPFVAALGCGAGYAVTATVDPSNVVCECAGANNTSATTFAVSAPDLAVTNLAASCNLDDTFTVTANVTNGGGQPASNVSIRVYADGVMVHDESQSIVAGATFGLSYITPPLRCAVPHTIRVVADEANVVCECSDANNEASTNAALCACPALSLSKSITNVWRKGASVGAAAILEPGDIIEYEAAITNNGGATAFHVDIADTLPNGLIYSAAAPGHDGQYTLSGGGNGTFPVPVGGSSFATVLHVTLSAGQSMTLRYCATALSSLAQGAILTNVAQGDGQEGDGTDIPTGGASATTSAQRPAFAIEKAVMDVLRGATSLGATGPVEPGDVVVYRATVRNIGGGTAYNVELHDALPAGLVYQSAGSYTVSAPAATGSLGIAAGATSFQTTIDATLAGGATLTANYTATATSSISGATPLVNTVSVAGEDGAGSSVPEEETSTSDSYSDEDQASIGGAKPALSVDKQVVDVRRGGASIGVVDPLLYNDVIVYRVAVRNVSLGTAYDVNLSDSLPSGLVVDTSTPLGSGSFSVSSPAASGGLGLSDGATSFSAAIGATIRGGGTLTAEFAARATPAALPSVWLTNTVTATGKDGAGSAIPQADATLGDTSDDDVEDSDADDTGIADIRVGIPALVTEKAILRIVRDGRDAPLSWIEVGDVVTYVLVARNVGQGPALHVALADTLPPGFSYRGPTSAVWPAGSSSAGPAGLPGASLSWALGARLEPGQEVRLTFDASVSGPVRQGLVYTNALLATGTDAVGGPIPADASSLVPEDDDLDDRSEVGVPGASPALVTDKRVLEVIRGGRSLGAATAIAAGDLVSFELVVTNVGLGTAYAVDVRDDLPPPLAFVAGTTVAYWPTRSGSYTANPVGSPGPGLEWPTQAVLGSGESVTLRFQSLVNGHTASGSTYRNVLSAFGLDGGRSPIPANNSADVSRDTDADDRDEVVLGAIVDLPALVTEKSIVELVRRGVRVHDDRIEIGDVLAYELVVVNVGPATAYDVNVTDYLPAEFAYVPGSAVIVTPAGLSATEPAGGGSSLRFGFSATLSRGERAVIRFDAEVVDLPVDGRWYVNDMQATGRDASGATIPADQRITVPADVDTDDASSASIRGRSWLTDGSGGLVSVPILRKTAETLGTGGCLGTTAEIDRVWFQTDIAMLAASEFARYAESVAHSDAFPETLLPTWGRTARGDLATYALENLLQVNVLSTLGVSLARGPRTVDVAVARGISPEEAVAERLAGLARLAGVTSDDLVPDGTWIYLEAEAGEPVFQSERNTPWGSSGTWATVDADIVGSSLGLGLVRQAQAAQSLAASGDAAERYVGWVLAEIMANKLAALDRDLTVRPLGSTSYVPHVSQALEQPDEFQVSDGASVLFDQASLLWGAARVLSFVQSTRSLWPSSERELADALETGARDLLVTALGAIGTYHTAADGSMVSRSPAMDGVWVGASTVDLGVLLVALDEALGVAGAASDALLQIQAIAARLLTSRQGTDGRFAEVATTAGVSTALAAQFAGIYGLLAVDDIAAAGRTFDFLESRAWDEWKGFGLYRLPEAVDVPLCYTALDMGLAVGAMLEYAARSDADRAALVERRLAAFARTILDDAALQLDNAGDGSQHNIAAGDGRGAIFPIRVARAEALAPVLQRSLCLVDIASETSCGGLRSLPHTPWYQTDISMYASSVLQASSFEREDDADANLIAVDFHAQLGVPFDAYPALAGLVGRMMPPTSKAEIDPIAVPFYAGDPYLGEEATSDLAWNAASFDTRIVPSAIGMTLLREAQEAAQRVRQSDRLPHDELTARVLAASIAKKIDVIEGALLTGPNGLSYVAHVYDAVPTADGVRMDVVDRSSDLFDQASLLLGLTETIAWAQDAAARSYVEASAGSSESLVRRAETLVDFVLGTLEGAHLRSAGDAALGVLADRAVPDATGWIAGDDVTVTPLGILAEALEKTAGAFEAGSALANRALALLETEVSFLRAALWDGSGGYRESWTARPEGEVACETPSLAGQLAAIRALLAKDRLLGSVGSEIRSAILSFESRFWDSAAELYVGQIDRLAWCMTPLDLALAVGVIPQAIAFVESVDAAEIASHLARHVDRALDAADLEIPARSLDEEGREQTYAPVFDRRVCLEPPSPIAGIEWTRPGDLVRYHVSVENATEETFLGLVLADVLPEGVALVSAVLAPSGIEDRRLQWAFDRLEPGAVRTWQIDVRVANAALGDVLTNCATLTYTDEAGVVRPTREVCASVTLGTADDARAAGLRSASVTYRTDEAMRLAWALDSAADRGLLGAMAEETREASRANLGLLLAESGLGVPFSLAAIWASPEDASAQLAALAASAGLPGVPDFASPIILPTSGGTPILDRGFGFIEKSRDITPAALGWTMAREASFLDAEAGASDPWAKYLSAYVKTALDGQVSWLDEISGLLADGPRFGHAVTATIEGGRATYSATDPRSLAYDQASLLLGLARVAACPGVAAETARRAATLASYVLSDLALHISEDGAVVASLDAGAPAAPWFDVAIVARALDETLASLPRLERQARVLLSALARPAREAVTETLREESARIDVLLIAGRALGDRTLRDAGLAAWVSYAASSVDRRNQVVFSAAALVGWRYTPAELALAFELLNEVAQADGALVPQAAGIAANLASGPLLAEHVQLWTPVGYWRDHVGVPCFGAAPVFAIHSGPLRDAPLWTLRGR